MFQGDHDVRVPPEESEQIVARSSPKRYYQGYKHIQSADMANKDKLGVVIDLFPVDGAVVVVSEGGVIQTEDTAKGVDVEVEARINTTQQIP